MGDMTWRAGTAPSLDGPEFFVVFKLETEDGRVEAAVDPPVARQIANALLAEAERADKEMTMTQDGHGLILPPGVRLTSATPATTTAVPCGKCGQPIEVELSTFAELRKQAGGQPFALEHETCGEERPALRTYHIEILIRRDPPQDPRPPQDTDVLGWFEVRQDAESLAMALPVLNEKLIPVWQKVQANLDVMDVPDDPQP